MRETTNMALTFNEMYLAADNGETSWEYALLLTGLLFMGENGLEVSPQPTNKAELLFYKIRIEVLTQHPNENIYYKRVLRELYIYIKDIDKAC